MLEPLRIHVQREPSGLLIANSPDLAGLHVMERTEEELFASLRELIPVLFAERNEYVRVVNITRVQVDEPIERSPWMVAGLRAASNERIDG